MDAPPKHPGPDRIVHLAGVTIGSDEPVPDTIVFSLETEDGDRLDLDLHQLLAALGFACQSGAVPAIPHSWIGQTRGIHGDVLPWSWPSR